MPLRQRLRTVWRWCAFGDVCTDHSFRRDAGRSEYYRLVFIVSTPFSNIFWWDVLEIFCACFCGGFLARLKEAIQLVT